MTNFEEVKKRLKLAEDLHSAANQIVKAVDIEFDLEVLKEFEWSLDCQSPVNYFHLTTSKAKSETAKKWMELLSMSYLVREQLRKTVRNRIASCFGACAEVSFYADSSSLKFTVHRTHLASEVQTFKRLFAEFGITDIEEESRTKFLIDIYSMIESASAYKKALDNLFSVALNPAKRVPDNPPDDFPSIESMLYGM